MHILHGCIHCIVQIAQFSYYKYEYFEVINRYDSFENVSFDINTSAFHVLF